MTELDYDQIKAVNFSSLKYMEKGPLHYLYNKQHPKKPTEAMALGTAVHCMVLEPEQFGERYAIIDLNRNSNAYKEQARLEAEAGRIILKTPELERIKLITASVRGHGHAMALLKGTERELTLQWEYDGVQRKGRVDAYKPGVLIDLKTCADPQPWAFSAQSFKMFYHAQMAFYAEGIKVLYGEYPEVYMIAVQNKEPYETVLYHIPLEVLQRGEMKINDWIEQLLDCIEADSYHGNYGGVQELALPGWAETMEVDDTIAIGGQKMRLNEETGLLEVTK